MNIRSMILLGLLSVNAVCSFAGNSVKLSFGHKRTYDCYANPSYPHELTPCEAVVLGCGICVAGGLMLYDALNNDTPRLSKKEELTQILERDLIDLKNVLKDKVSLYQTSLRNYTSAYDLSEIYHLKGTAVQKVLRENSYLSKKVKNILESTKQIVYSLQHGYYKDSELISYHKKRIARNLKKAVAIIEKALEDSYPFSMVQKQTRKLRDLITYFNESQSYWY